MGITLQQVRENNLLSDDVLDCIPETCECGAPIEFTDSLRQIYCSNPRCTYKVAARLEAMAKHMKADGWGESTCVTVCKEYKLISPYQVFLLEDLVKNGATSDVAAFEKKVNSICDRAKRRVELWEVVRLAGIPSIETIAYKIFNGYDNFAEAFSDIESGQVPFVAEKLGLKNSDGGVMAVNIYNTLLQYKDEILFGETQFDIYKPQGRTLYMAITGGVAGFRNKSEFVNYLKARYLGKINPMLMNSVTSQVEILIADNDTNSNKYKTANRINSKCIEKGLASGEFTQAEIGTFKKTTDLHPIGEQVLITDSESVIERLDRVFLATDNTEADNENSEEPSSYQNTESTSEGDVL